MRDVIEPVDGEPQNVQSLLIDASERLAAAHSMDEVVEVLRQTAREAVGAEGIAVVIREQGRCFYAAEDAIGPLGAVSLMSTALHKMHDGLCAARLSS